MVALWERLLRAVDTGGTSPTDPRATGELARAWLSTCDRRVAEVRVFRALRRAGFDAAVAARPVALPAVPAAALPYALAALSDRDLVDLADRLAGAPDPDGALTEALGAVEQERAGRALPARGGPLADLAALLDDAGAAPHGWLRAAGRMVAGWGRLRRRYPHLTRLVTAPCELDDVDDQALVFPTSVPPPPATAGETTGFGSSPEGRAFAATAAGDEPRAIAAITACDAVLGAPWFEGLLLRADLAEARGALDEARALLDRAAVVRRPDVALLRADLEAFAGDDEAALAALEPIGRHPMARPRRAAALLRLGRVTQAAALGLTPEPRELRPAEDTGPSRPSLDVLLDEHPEPHARAAALAALGHEREHAETLAALLTADQATEPEVLDLARWIAAGGGLEGLDLRALADRVLTSTEAALPGASGLAAAESGALATALLSAAGDVVRAEDVGAARARALDRTLEEGGAGAALGAALMDAAAEAAERGHLTVWRGRRSWILRLASGAAPGDAVLLRAAARLVRALRSTPEDARAVAEAALALLPGDDAGVDALPAEASRAAFELLAAHQGTETALADPRFQHAAARRVAQARELRDAGRLAEAATSAAALLRKPLLPEERATLVTVLVDAADGTTPEEARAALIREAAGMAELAARDRPAAAAALSAMAPLRAQEVLAELSVRLLAAWPALARHPRVAAAAADLLGCAAAAALQGGAQELPPLGVPLLEASPYLLARAIVAARTKLAAGAAPPRVSSRSPLPLPLLEAVRSGASLLDLARLLRRRNWDPADLPALLTA